MRQTEQVCEPLSINPEELTAPQAPSPFRPLALGLSLAAGLLRLFPHAWNLTPMGGVAIFAGARLPLWQAFAVPLGLMAVTDTILYLIKDDRPFDPFVYGSFVLCVLLGRTLARTESPFRILGTALAGSVVFYLITNFGAWVILTATYPRSLDGLWLSYLAGIPFYRGTFLGDMLFAPLLFVSHAVLTRTYFATERVPAPVSTKF